MGKTTAELRQERLVADPDFRKRWERTALARAVANALIRYRIDQGWTQTRLGQELGLRQPQIARLESGEHNPTFDTLQHLSGRLGLRFVVEFTPTHERLDADHYLGSPTFKEEETTSTGTVTVSSGVYAKAG